MYETTTLSISKEEARQLIADRLQDLSVTVAGETIEFRSNAGVLLAVLSDTSLPAGERGAILRYRTTLISPSFSHARSQAQIIRRTVDQYETKNTSSG